MFIVPLGNPQQSNEIFQNPIALSGRHNVQNKLRQTKCIKNYINFQIYTEILCKQGCGQIIVLLTDVILNDIRNFIKFDYT